jgi:arsenate reductase (thioredoxin)
MTPDKPVVLVLCTGNSCRSQMAEAFLRKYAADRFAAYSAGLDPKPEIHPMARQVMVEAGIDLAGQYPKSTKEYLGRLPVRHLILVCAQAEKQCPRIFPGAMNRLFWPFDDPAAEGSEQEGLEKFREVRDQIDHKIKAWLETL